jgi:hypothetical protein
LYISYKEYKEYKLLLIREAQEMNEKMNEVEILKANVKISDLLIGE